MSSRRSVNPDGTPAAVATPPVAEEQGQRFYVVRDGMLGNNGQMLGYDAIKSLFPERFTTRDASNTFPTKFQPPRATDTPESLFVRGLKLNPSPASAGNQPKHRRFMSREGGKDILIYTDGACLNNGTENATAGCAFVFLPKHPTQPTEKYENISFRLESHGPNKDPQPQTSNRAELRAVIAALQFRIWPGEGWERLIIATDSEYVVNGATEWIQNWQQKDWVTAKKEPVKNRDLWELLLKEVRKHVEKGMDVLFWAIPRELNKEADALAKEAALKDEVPQFVKRSGIMVTTSEMVVIERPLNLEDE
ncbi:ribonuclease H-like protein [Acephala macrosclerotiorum]|nr:ribonuclease H-like protein [Acephala macrosclerotiorum]